jgi:hypothetical protein
LRRREWAVARFSVIAILPYPMLLSAVLMRRRKISPRRPSQRSTHAASRRPDGFHPRSDLKPLVHHYGSCGSEPFIVL